MHIALLGTALAGGFALGTTQAAVVDVSFVNGGEFDNDVVSSTANLGGGIVLTTLGVTSDGTSPELNENAGILALCGARSRRS